MSVNVSKTKYILFRPRGKKILHNLDENGIIYNSNEIGGIDDKSKIFKLGRIHNEHANINERTYKFLGVHLDEYLSFDTHCTIIFNKLAQSNFIISKVKNILSVKTLKTLYFSLIYTPTSFTASLSSAARLKKMLKKSTKCKKKPSGWSQNPSLTLHPIPSFPNLKSSPLNTSLPSLVANSFIPFIINTPLRLSITCGLQMNSVASSMTSEMPTYYMSPSPAPTM